MAKAKAAKKAKPNPRNKKLYDDGMKMRKAVLGAGYVDNSMAGAANDDFMMSFQDVTTEDCWGYVWTRPGPPEKNAPVANPPLAGGTQSRTRAQAARQRRPEQRPHQGGDQGDLPAGRDLLRHPGQPRRLQDCERGVQGTWDLTYRHPDRSLA